MDWALLLTSSISTDGLLLITVRTEKRPCTGDHFDELDQQNILFFIDATVKYNSDYYYSEILST